MEMTFNVSDEEHKKLVDQAKEELREEMENKVVREELCAKIGAPLYDLFKTFGLPKEYDRLKEKKVKDLTKEEMSTVLIYSIFYKGL